MVIDENRKPGGQLFKQIHKFFGSEVHKAGTRGFRIGEQLLAETLACGVWAPEIGAMAGLNIPIKPRRGQVYITRARSAYAS